MARKSAHITTFILEGDDYFVANLDNGGVCVGLKNAGRVEIPAEHPSFMEASAIRTEDAAEEFFYGNLKA